MAEAPSTTVFTIARNRSPRAVGGAETVLFCTSVKARIRFASGLPSPPSEKTNDGRLLSTPPSTYLPFTGWKKPGIEQEHLTAQATSSSGVSKVLNVLASTVKMCL